jgi:hypothetical protein
MKQAQQRALNASIATETALPDITSAKGNKFVDLGFVSGSQAGTGNTDPVMDYGKAFGDAIAGASNAYASTDEFKQAAERDAINGKAAGKLFAQQERNRQLALKTEGKLDNNAIPSILLSKQHEAIAMQGEFSSYYSNAFTAETQAQFEVLTNQSYKDAYNSKVQLAVSNVFETSGNNILEMSQKVANIVHNPEQRNAITAFGVGAVLSRRSANVKENQTAYVAQLNSVSNDVRSVKRGVTTPNEYTNALSALIAEHKGKSDRQISALYMSDALERTNPIEELAKTIAVAGSLTVDNGIKLLSIKSDSVIKLNTNIIALTKSISDYNIGEALLHNPNAPLNFDTMNKDQIGSLGVHGGALLNKVLGNSSSGVLSTSETKAMFPHMEAIATHKDASKGIEAGIDAYLAPLNTVVDEAIAKGDTQTLAKVMTEYAYIQGEFHLQPALQNLIKKSYLKLNGGLGDVMILSQAGYLQSPDLASQFLLGAQANIEDSGTKKKKLQVTANSVHTAMLKEGSGYAQFNEDELLMYADRVASVYHYLEVNGKKKSVTTLVSKYAPKELVMEAASIAQPEGSKINVPVNIDASLWSVRLGEAEDKGALAQGILAYAHSPSGVLQSEIRKTLTTDLTNTMFDKSFGSKVFDFFQQSGTIAKPSEARAAQLKAFTDYTLLGEHIEGIDISDSTASEGSYNLTVKFHGTELTIIVSELWLATAQAKGKVEMKRQLELQSRAIRLGGH